MSASSAVVVEPYFGGSHRAWAEGLRDHLGIPVTLVTMPARWWKWRMRGSAPDLADQLRTLDVRPEVVIASDMVDLAAFRLFAGQALGGAPVALYFHESQLTYPDSPQMEPDLSYAFTNWVSALAADRILFNSAYHRDVFFAELPRLLRHFPDYTHEHRIPDVRARSEVLEVGVDLSWVGPRPARRGSLRILWNHRWEHDKDPATFFAAVDVLAAEGLEFEVVVCGENFRLEPEEFEAAARRHSDSIVHLGFAPIDQYRELLLASDVVVSTARQEFFGMAVVEAMAAGCMPLLPNRLSYPELVPPQWHAECLYAPGTLADRLRRLAESPEVARQVGPQVAGSMARFGWPAMAPRYRATLDALLAG